MTTPREMARLMALIAEGKAVNREASDAMLATLRRQQDRAMIPRLLPADDRIQIGNKTGTDEEKHPLKDGVKRHVRADAAIVTGPDFSYVIAIYARQVEDTRWGVDNDALTTGARVSRVIYDYFSGAKGKVRVRFGRSHLRDRRPSSVYALVVEQPALAVQPSPVAREAPVAADDAMARQDDRDGVRAIRGAHGTHRRRRAHSTRQIRVGRRRARRHGPQGVPDALLEGRAVELDLDFVQARQVTAEIADQDAHHASGIVG